MATDLLSENSSPVGMSPRISFSHDLSPSDINFPVEQRLLRSISSSSVDFDFCIHQISFNQESTSAEELFSNGKILPTQVKEKIFAPNSIPPSAPPPPAPPHDHHGAVDSRKNNSKNEKDSNERTKCTSGSSESSGGGGQKQKSKSSFWQFKRSSSLNCGNSYARSLCPLPPLLRSNSTGSASSSKRSSSSKDGLNHNKQHSQKTPLVAPIKHPQFSPSNTHQKPPAIKKNGYGPSHGNGTVRINPVLNVPSANLFGLGAIFSSNKEMKKMKKKKKK